MPKKRTRKTSFVPRVIFSTVFASVVPAVVIACGSDSSPAPAVSEVSGVADAAFETCCAVADIAFDTHFSVADSAFDSGFAVADTGFGDTTPEAADGDVGKETMPDGVADIGSDG